MTHTPIFSRESDNQSIEVAAADEYSNHGVPWPCVLLTVEMVGGAADYRIYDREEAEAFIRGLQNSVDLIWPE